MFTTYDMVDMFAATLAGQSPEQYENFRTNIARLLNFVHPVNHKESMSDDQLRMAFSDWSGFNVDNDRVLVFSVYTGGNCLVAHNVIRAFFYAKMRGYRFNGDIFN
jgi:hypothetical protein